MQGELTGASPEAYRSKELLKFGREGLESQRPRAEAARSHPA